MTKLNKYNITEIILNQQLPLEEQINILPTLKNYWHAKANGCLGGKLKSEIENWPLTFRNKIKQSGH